MAAFVGPIIGSAFELRASAAEDRMAAVLALGDHHEAIAELETMVADEPLRERRWTLLMLALYRDGRQADAYGSDMDR